MKTQDKKEYILKVHEQFEGADNHGGRNNWWYPEPYRIAYRIKLSRFPDGEKIKDAMSTLQKSYSSEDDTEDLIWHQIEQAAEALVALFEDRYGLSAYIAGRMGGWLEVQYEPLTDVEDLEDGLLTAKEVHALYKEAQELERLEAEVEREVEDFVKNFESYISSDDFVRDFTQETLLQDEDIREIYREKAAEYEELAKE